MSKYFLTFILLMTFIFLQSDFVFAIELDTIESNQMQELHFNSTLFVDNVTLDKDIDKILKEVKKIESKKKYSKVEKTLLGRSAQGAGITFLSDGKEVKKITVVYYGETGKAVSTYYFNSNKLIFLLKKIYYYDQTIYNESHPKIIKIEEENYYFYNENLIKWIDRDKKAVIQNMKRVKKGKEELRHSKKLIDMMRSKEEVVRW